jgi:hypothetical protein
MMFVVVLLAVLLAAALAVLPIWPFSEGWGYGPAIVIGIVLLILMFMALTGRVPGLEGY